MKTHKLQSASKWQPNEIGLYAGLSMEQYLDAPGASRSLLARVAARPSTAHERGESTEAMRWGTLFNDLLLFGQASFHTKPETYLGDPQSAPKPWNGNATACKQWLAEHTDRPVLRARGDHSAEWLTKALEQCQRNARVVALLKLCPHREATVFARHEEDHFLLKGRPDLLGLPEDTGGPVIDVDVKTTTDAGTVAFGREMLRFGYHKQLALRRQIYHALGLSPVQAFLIIVEKGDAPRVQVRQVAERALDKGDLDLDDEMKIYHRCKISGTWPDFADEPEPHITGIIDLPDRCYAGEIDDLKGMTEAEETAA